MDQNMQKMIILENYNNPCNKGLIDDDTYIKVNMNSLSCIDNVDYMLKIENDKIIDVKYDGEACVISTSASSIMSNLILGRTLDEVLNIINNYEKMINEEEYDDSILQEANVFCDIAKQPNRKKCALLPFNALKKAILEYKK